MNAIIIEDEPLSARRLKNLLTDINPLIKVENILDSIETSVRWLIKYPHPSLIFMDIQLSDGLCFEIFKRVVIRTPVIFTTAYDEYALDAFKVNSIDYLLKPIDKDELKRSLQKFEEMRNQYRGVPDVLIDKLLSALEGDPRLYKSRFLLKSGQSMVTVFDKDIAYFVSDRKLTFLVTYDGKKHPMDETLEELERQVNPREFFRVNRQFLASIESIVSVHKYFNGKLKLHIKPPTDLEVIVSREKMKTFKNWLGK